MEKTVTSGRKQAKFFVRTQFLGYILQLFGNCPFLFPADGEVHQTNKALEALEQSFLFPADGEVHQTSRSGS